MAVFYGLVAFYSRAKSPRRKGLVKCNKSRMMNATKVELRIAFELTIYFGKRSIEQGAVENLPGFKVVRKLLSDRRFDK